MGDFNTCFNHNNAQTRCLNEVIDRNDMSVIWNSPKVNHDNTYVNLSLGHRSCMDHILVSGNIFDALISGGVHYDPLNPSCHNVVNIHFQCVNHCFVTRSDRPELADKRFSWNKATQENIDMYREQLDYLLGNINIPTDAILCRNVLCKDIKHRVAINTLCSDILNCCIEAGTHTLPLRKYTKHSIAGWKEYVKPEKERSLFWHWIWLECGRPNHGHVYNIMKQTRYRYHYAVRYAKKNEFNLKKEKLAEYSANGSVDMWRELKKINPSRCNIPTTVDDACNAPDIAELFMSKYETLYNSVPTSDDELDDITRLINNGVVNESYDNIKFSVDVITKCIRRIKSGKSDGNMGFDSDHLLNGTSKLCYMISVLFNVMIMHGHSAQDLLYSTIVSIPKNKRASLCCSDNYRGIALCCS